MDSRNTPNIVGSPKELRPKYIMLEVSMYPPKPSSNYDDGTRFDMDSQKASPKDLLNLTLCLYEKNFIEVFPNFTTVVKFCLITEATSCAEKAFLNYR